MESKKMEADMAPPSTGLSAEDGPRGEDGVYDFVGIGFGPSNLALAVAAGELDPRRRGIFFELKSSFDWHPGMMLDGSRMQISFLKDLVTLRNPASPYTFLQYTKAKGRLERFVNLAEFHPTRMEYQDYLRWVAGDFSAHVKYGRAVRRVTPVRLDGDARHSVFRVEVENVETRQTSVYFARNVVYASGGKPRVPAEMAALAPRVIHSSEFVQRFPQCFAERTEVNRFAVVGDGQSAGEIVAELLRRHPRARVDLFISGYAPRPADRSSFVNEVFFSDEVEAFYQSSEAKRAAVQGELRNTNYGVMDSDLIAEIYRNAYLDEVKGARRLFVHPFSKLVSAQENGDGMIVTIQDRCGGADRTLPCDALVLATGYERGLDPAVFADLLPFVAQSDSGRLSLTRNYRVQTTNDMDCGLYVQGYGESSHGLGDTLLSLLPFRSKDIFNDLCERARATEQPRRSGSEPAPAKRNGDGDYPPARHLENDPEKLYAVVERFRFATLISVDANGEPVVTHVPLILDRSRCAKGILFGHMDRSNPHVELLEGSRVLALFHGPNAYISPHTYETDQLPTWNSITVHVRATCRVLSDQQAVVRGLCSICEQSDQRPGAYRLNPEDPRIERLIDYIVGFELEIDELIGRFKLSQDRTDADRQRATTELVRHTEAGERLFIERTLGYR